MGRHDRGVCVVDRGPRPRDSVDTVENDRRDTAGRVVAPAGNRARATEEIRGMEIDVQKLVVVVLGVELC